MTVERMKRPWSVIGAGFNDDGVYFTFDDTTIHRADVRLMEAAPDLLEALQGYMSAVSEMNEAMKDGYNVQGAMSALIGWEDMARAAISKALGEE